MKRIIISLFLGSMTFLLIGCGLGEVESADGSENNSVAAENSNESAKESKETPIEEITSSETALEKGNEFFDHDQNGKAIEAFKQAVKLDPDLAEAHFKLGIAYAIKESQEELLPQPTVQPSSDDKKKKKDNKPKKVNSEIAFENAVTAYKKIVKKDPKNADAYFNLGRAYNKLSQDEEAKEALEKAVKLEPENSPYQTEYGEVLIKFAKYDLAIRALNKAIEIDEANSQAAELLKTAEAGKKRVDYGAEKLKEQAAAKE